MSSKEVVFSTENKKIDQDSGIYTQTMGFQREKFTIWYDKRAGTLQIFTDRVSKKLFVQVKKYIVEVTHKESTITVTATFTAELQYCQFAGITWPFKIAICSKGWNYTGLEMPYVGIRNCGVTCYMASSIQFLARVTPFVELLIGSDCKAGSVGRELQKTLVTLMEGETSGTVHSLITAFGASAMQLSMQEQDAHEFILKLVDVLDKELGSEFEKARSAIFRVSTVNVIECKAASIRKEFGDVSEEIHLPVEGLYSIYEALDAVTATKRLEGADQWDTETESGKQDAISYIRYKQLPPFLMFNLGRYTYVKRRGVCAELTTLLDCPEQVDMRPYCVPEYEEETQYKIATVIAHRGNMQSGHYIALTRINMDDVWIKFDDTSVSQCSFKAVRNMYGCKFGIKKMLRKVFGSGPLAYLVGYIRKDQVDMFQKRIAVPRAMSVRLSDSFAARKVYAEKVTCADIMSSGECVTWEGKLLLDDMFNEDKDHVVFVMLPNECDHMYGPLDRVSDASMYTVPSGEGLFIGIPRDAMPSPVFFTAMKEYIGVFNAATLMSKFSNEYSFRVNGIALDDLSGVSTGAVVTGVPRKTVRLIVDDHEYEVSASASYEDVQRIVGGVERAPRVLFYTAGFTKLLRPRRYPTAVQLYVASPLTVAYLDTTTSIGCIDMLQSITVDLCDPHRNWRTSALLWVMKSITVPTLLEQLHHQFDIDSDPSVVCSVSCLRENLVVRILDSRAKVPSSTRLRVDVLGCRIPCTSLEMLAAFDYSSGLAAIELRKLTYDSKSLPHFETVGFAEIANNATGPGVLKALNVTEKGVITLRTVNGFTNAYQLKGNEPIAGLLRNLTDDVSWANRRPVIVLQVES